MDKSLFAGVSNTSFDPNGLLTRAMFVSVLGRASGVDVSAYTESGFSDVNMGSYYGGYVKWASDNKIVAGIGDGEFAPDALITREQIATMLTNYMKYKGEGPVGAWAIQLTYTDLGMVSDWAGEGVMFTTLKAFMSGYPDGSFGPQKYATRAEGASLMDRYLTPVVVAPAN